MGGDGGRGGVRRYRGEAHCDEPLGCGTALPLECEGGQASFLPVQYVLRPYGVDVGDW